MAYMLVFIKVITAHDCPCSAVLNSSFESRKINLVKRTVIYNRVCCVTVYLMVVECVMLHTGCHPVTLYALYVRNDHLGCKIRVFTHILEVASV